MKKWTKLTKPDWFCITALYKIYDYRAEELAEELDISRQHIHRIIRRTEKVFGKEIFKNKKEVK
jgi:predicted DNA-binding protein YlxM (UPF0122 family)